MHYFTILCHFHDAESMCSFITLKKSLNLFKNKKFFHYDYPYRGDFIADDRYQYDRHRMAVAILTWEKNHPNSSQVRFINNLGHMFNHIAKRIDLLSDMETKKRGRHTENTLRTQK